jgi:hypothetical protein
MQTRGNHPDYHLLHNGYQAGAPSEDWVSSLSENLLAEHDDLDHDHDQAWYSPLNPYHIPCSNI